MLHTDPSVPSSTREDAHPTVSRWMPCTRSPRTPAVLRVRCSTPLLLPDSGAHTRRRLPPRISPFLPGSPQISPDLPIPPRISPDLPRPPHITTQASPPSTRRKTQTRPASRQSRLGTAPPTRPTTGPLGRPSPPRSRSPSSPREPRCSATAAESACPRRRRGRRRGSASPSRSAECSGGPGRGGRRCSTRCAPRSTSSFRASARSSSAPPWRLLRHPSRSRAHRRQPARLPAPPSAARPARGLAPDCSLRRRARLARRGC